MQLELIEEQYAFGPDESLHLVYRLTGDLEAIGLVPTPPAPEITGSGSGGSRAFGVSVPSNGHVGHSSTAGARSAPAARR